MVHILEEAPALMVRRIHENRGRVRKTSRGEELLANDAVYPGQGVDPVRGPLIVGVDGSDASLFGLREAASMAQATRAALIIQPSTRFAERRLGIK